MSSRSLYYTRVALATPAILLFVATCLAQGIRGGNNSGHYSVRGSIVSVGEGEDESKNDNVSSGDGNISLEHHHGHHYRSQDNPEADDRFDFYAYSMSYQPEFCKENNEKFVGCHNPSEDWEGQLTIHGLWPNRDDGTWPSDCSNEKLDTTLLQTLSDDLAQKWPNVKASSTSPGHEAFWAHEWSKHGTCSGLSQQDYFMTALDLLLPTPSIVRENYGSVVKREDLEKGYLGSDMSVFVCKNGYLSEVRVCFEKVEDGAVGERVTCPESILKEDSCGDEIKIASFDSRTTIAID
jgi:ribonuclease T2